MIDGYTILLLFHQPGSEGALKVIGHSSLKDVGNYTMQVAWGAESNIV